jgi:hypothetical protein
MKKVTIKMTPLHTELEACGEFQATQKVQESRVANGQCPGCGNRLYKIKHGIFKKSPDLICPLTIQGQVLNGQCVPCLLHVSHVIPTEENAIEHTVAETLPVEMAVTYHGDYNVCGERHGEGVLTWSSGDAYVGQFFHGQRHGQGTLTFADGGEYVGEWSDNQMEGLGTCRYQNGNVYTGQYQRGRRHGQGQCYFANGDYYEGEWHEDEIEGYGRYYYDHGHVYEGWFVKGHRHGMGKYQYDSGILDIHKYENDERVGEGFRWSRDRKKAWRTYDGVVRGRVSPQAAFDAVPRFEEKGLRL